MKLRGTKSEWHNKKLIPISSPLSLPLLVRCFLLRDLPLPVGKLYEPQAMYTSSVKYN